MSTFKRGRLIEAAQNLFYQQGITNTTLANVAERAEVPLGNVYYYFHTKEALIEAVVYSHIRALEAQFEEWEQIVDPRQRLLKLLASERHQPAMVARYGCPHGTLCQELDKEDTPLTQTSARIFEAYLNWVCKQFRLIGKGDQESHELAFDLISALQGTYLLANCFRSPEMLESKLLRLERWLLALSD